ncbi:MAG: DNA/RNA non-specific endonuclease, partial [Chitinophagaceae bacterium]
MKLTYFKNMSRILFLATIVFSFTNCNKDVVKPEQEKVSPKPQFSIIAAEGFESGTKTAYAGATVTLSTGNWYLNEALIGNSTSDRKAGTKSARVRDLGKLTMQFNVTGASTISVKHTIYGTDLSSTWQLWASTNSGSTWTQVGSTITTSSTTLQTVNFTANYTSAVRFEIRKVSGGSNRINIDDISIDYSGGGGSGDDGSGSVHLTMGNPSSAITNTTYPDNYLMVKNQYALSYNKSKATCNWVAWHLNTSWIGSTPRQDDFRADATLPSGWYQVGSSSYSGSGFDR